MPQGHRHPASRPAAPPSIDAGSTRRNHPFATFRADPPAATVAPPNWTHLLIDFVPSSASGSGLRRRKNARPLGSSAPSLSVSHLILRNPSGRISPPRLEKDSFSPVIPLSNTTRQLEERSSTTRRLLCILIISASLDHSTGWGYCGSSQLGYHFNLHPLAWRNASIFSTPKASNTTTIFLSSRTAYLTGPGRCGEQVSMCSWGNTFLTLQEESYSIVFEPVRAGFASSGTMRKAGPKYPLMPCSIRSWTNYYPVLEEVGRRSTRLRWLAFSNQRVRPRIARPQPTLARFAASFAGA